MNGVFSHDSALQGYTGPGTTWANEMNLAMKHAPGAGTKENECAVPENMTKIIYH